MSEGFLNQEFRKNRGYDDYLKYMEKHPDTPLIQMDTVTVSYTHLDVYKRQARYKPVVKTSKNLINWFHR